MPKKMCAKFDRVKFKTQINDRILEKMIYKNYDVSRKKWNEQMRWRWKSKLYHQTVESSS